MQLTTIEHAYSSLVDTVRSFEVRGRVCLGATLKPALLSALGEGISERTLGFRRFGDFLRSAQISGRIDILSHPGGDIEIRLPSARPSTQQLLLPTAPNSINAVAAKEPYASPSGTSASLRVRPDLWRAFNAVAAGWFYDRSRDLAVKITEAQQREIADRLVTIPSARPRLLSWMQSFTELQSPAIREALSAQLEREKNSFAFELSLKNTPGLLRAWRRYHVQQIISEIDVWASANQLKLADIAAPFASLRPQEERKATIAPATREGGSTPSTGTFEVRPKSEYAQKRLPNVIDNLIEQLVLLRGLLAMESSDSSSDSMSE